MNKEHYSDQTAEVAIGRVYNTWKKEVKKNG